MEHLEGEQYSQYTMERNPRVYMSMRDYRNLPWRWQQPVERNLNPCRSMREYRDQWTSTPSYSVTPTYAPPPNPQYASLSQPQPSQPISPIEQAILDLTKLVGDVMEEQKKFNAQLSQKIHTVENSLDQKFDGLQSEMDKKIDNLQFSISKLAQQLDHQKEENPEKECLIDTTVEEQYKMQDEAISPLLTEESSGKEAGEEPQVPILQPIPMNLNPSATGQPQNSPLPVYILPTPVAQPTPGAPTGKATSIALPILQKF